MQNLRELETTVLQGLASSVKYYRSLGLDNKSSKAEIETQAKLRAEAKFDKLDNDENMIDLVNGQMFILTKVRRMLSSKEEYQKEYDKQLDAMILDDADDLEGQMKVLFGDDE